MTMCVSECVCITTVATVSQTPSGSRVPLEFNYAFTDNNNNNNNNNIHKHNNIIIPTYMRTHNNLQVYDNRSPYDKRTFENAHAQWRR